MSRLPISRKQRNAYWQKKPPRKKQLGKAVSVAQSAKEGFLISILNPKIALFFIVLFSQFVAAGEELSSKVIIVITPFVVDGLWYSCIAVIISSAIFVEKLRTHAVLIDRLSGGVLIVLAVRVFFIV
jgi:threonine/homoserine/homoserine lactone efflux protein